MVIYVDIDNTICKTNSSAEYDKAVPIKSRIEKINKLYEAGNTIIYWTARGTKTGKNWRDLTERQFREWGVRCHELHFQKPVYDLFIDDKNIESNTYFEDVD
tara:strand:+ start:531 stop:836 length:306 start_codon:yes stop_codon:yes gene_type:complete